MDRFDLVIIGAGAAGEAAANAGRKRDASVAVIDRDLFGGSCPFFACMPSKSLLHSAAVHAAGGDYPWPKASDRRDWMINRERIDYPDDGIHVQQPGGRGARDDARNRAPDGPGRVVVTHDGVEHELEAGAVVVAVGSTSKIPDLPGLDQVPVWTNREATATGSCPRAWSSSVRGQPAWSWGRSSPATACR